MKRKKEFCSDKISSYFRAEWLSLTFITISRLLYNVELITTPWFEGRRAGCLADILNGDQTASAMPTLVIYYIVVTLIVQAARFVKRFYVRRFANSISRRMKGILYANLIRENRNTFLRFRHQHYWAICINLHNILP